MIEEPKSSRFAYILGAVLIVGMVAIGYWVKRSPGPAAPPSKQSVLVTPDSVQSGAIPAGNITTLPPPKADEAAVLASFATALRTAGQPGIEKQLPDLLAVLQFTPADPLPANPTPAQLQAAAQAHKDRIEGILAGSMLFLNEKQLEIYRAELNRVLKAPGSK
jgi:hypothetical protein